MISGTSGGAAKRVLPRMNAARVFGGVRYLIGEITLNAILG